MDVVACVTFLQARRQVPTPPTAEKVGRTPKRRQSAINGHLETVVKRIDQVDGSYKDYISKSLADNLGRAYQVTYPDGDVVRYTYDARGFLSSVPGFVNGITYNAGGQKSSSTLGNGVTTTYTYDPRLRLSHLIARANGTIFQELTYEFDQVSNLLRLTDDHAPDGPRNQSATFEIDNLYRLTRAEGNGYGEGFGIIEYDYDRLGNMISKTSLNIVDDDVDLGSISSGGSGGTSGRIGREPGDPPGPHALTATDNGQRQRMFEYDDNGNMTSNDGDVYEYDFADRLVRVIKDGRDVSYLYDYSGRRVIKRVDGVQTSYIGSASEVRNGKMIKYVRSGSDRLARVEGSIPPSGFVIQTVDLVLGWNLISFQVDPGSTDPATVLDSIDGLYSTVFGHASSGYTRYIPGDPDNTLTELLPNAGYWVKMVALGQLVLEGPVSQAGVDVPADTPVLVAFPGLTASSLADLLTRYPDLTGLWSYNGGSEEWEIFGADAPSYVNTLDETASGRGYWLVSSAPITLTSAPAGEARFYHSDHLGSTSTITDANGDLVSEYYNYPFGMLRHQHDEGDPFDPNDQFTGQEQDKESGLHYFEARYYGSAFARFTRVDPLLAGQVRLESPQRLNLYAYAGNRPVVRIDPTGLDESVSAKLGLFKEEGSLSASQFKHKDGSDAGKREWVPFNVALGSTGTGVVAEAGVSAFRETIIYSDTAGNTAQLQAEILAINASLTADIKEGLGLDIGASIAKEEVEFKTCEEQICGALTFSLSLGVEAKAALGPKKLGSSANSGIGKTAPAARIQASEGP